MDQSNPTFRRTTVLSVRRGDQVAMGGDGQVSLGNTVMKNNAVKVRKLADGNVLVGFAGSAADSLSLLERFQEHISKYGKNTLKAAIELAKQWRTDKILRRLESVLAVADRDISLLVSGTGDVIEPSDGIIGIGSGGGYAIAAARSLLRHTDLSAEEVVKESLTTAADICIYTNKEIEIITL